MSNSQPLNNDALYKSYGDRFGDFDEATYWAWVRVEGGKLVSSKPYQEIKHDLVRHHLWSIGRRPDVRSNLLIVTEDMHRYFHANLSASRVICVLAKLRKAELIGEPEEFCLDEVNMAAGKFVSGVVGNYNFRDPLLRRLNEQCCERLAVLEKEGVV